ncbi:HesB/YadR/YfhF family protein [Wolbachia endosymbiont of Drosophila simulans wNo]|uniref:HesB/IscA family protein n=1 Tax=unclassified Wolbachia TaxID=2640676 RepID=UPI0002D24F11|nr:MULTISPECIES: iron-sulfur cluster biosynthesis family protein [unclassified Wolbachia]AGJ98906.1 HesB/YadR/YfhF family protein [Wolbachia endosymbiont of Drosophila simulans wNo]QCB63070.1 heme biosynthesis protein HemY [Wolbachia endosymbiont of Drosophila mauritiana]QCB64115.1 heme biosynthesis protein HemY [Wolbachia endosymbiont of Drosophila mauritiana]QWE33558.1 HesB/YadR/YfhF family protein [Wolbachia endosymbiont of Drosophila simulans]TGB05923.1 heme biosynthesis protein HemY [Wolb
MSTDYNINLTDNALRKIHSLVEQEGDQSSVLRVAVSGGGCSGFKYNFLMDQINKKMSLDDDFEDDEDSEDYRSHSSFSEKGKDIVINDENGNPVLMVDNCSAKFLNNSTIDYTEDLSGSGFQIKNSLAKSRCGCGNSFSV